MAIAHRGRRAIARRRIIIPFIILAGLIAALHFSAPDLIDHRLRKWVANLAPGISAEWRSLEILPFSPGIRFREARIQWKNPREPDTTIHFTSEILDIGGIDLAALLLAGNFRAEEVRIRDWTCSVKGRIGDILSGGYSGDSSQSMPVHRWKIENGTFSWSEGRDNLGGAEARLESLVFSKKNPGNTTRMTHLSAGAVRIGFPAAMADVTVEKITFNRKKGNLKVMDLVMKPRWSEREFGLRKGFQTDRVGFHIREMTVAWQGESGGLPEWTPHLIELRNPRLEIFRDRRVHRKSGMPKRKSSPFRILQQFPFRIHALQIRIHNGDIHYAEQQPGARSPGRLWFSRLSARITGFQAGPVEPGSSHPIHMGFTCRFQGDIPFSGDFDMHTGRPDFRFSGKLGAVELPVLNSLLIPMAFLRIDTGKMDGARWNLVGNDNHLQGWMQAKYGKLRLTLLKHREPPQKRGLATFLVNLLILRNNPEKGEPLRRAHIHLERNPTRGFFNWVWRGLLEGLKRSAGI